MKRQLGRFHLRSLTFPETFHWTRGPSALFIYITGALGTLERPAFPISEVAFFLLVLYMYVHVCAR